MQQNSVCYPGQDLTYCSVPQYCDNDEHKNPIITFKKREVWPSKMFMIKLELDKFVQHNPGKEIFDASQGDGGLSLGGIPKEELAEALKSFLPETRTTQYGDPVGSLRVRKAIFENYYRFDQNTGLTPENIIIGDGGRDILQKWYQAILQSSGTYGGNILVSAAPWGSYPEAVYINGFNLICAPGNPDNAFKITPEGIDAALEFSATDGRRIAGIILTSPDNPTGNYLNYEELITLVEYATQKHIDYILIDLIYQAVTDPEIGCYDINKIYKAISPEAKMRVCFMDGLTKKAGASNLRNAHLVCGSVAIAKKIKGIATHTILPNVIGESAAWEIYRHEKPLEHPWIKRVVQPTAESRKIVKNFFTQLHYKFICDQGYYAFVNIFPWLGKKIPKECELKIDNNPIQYIDNVEILKSYLATKWGIAVIHGSVFKQPHFIRFSYANTPEYTAGAIQRFHQALSNLA